MILDAPYRSYTVNFTQLRSDELYSVALSDLIQSSRIIKRIFDVLCTFLYRFYVREEYHTVCLCIKAYFIFIHRALLTSCTTPVETTGRGINWRLGGLLGESYRAW